MGDKVRFGILGLGSISQTHIAALREISQAEITAVCSRKREKAEAVAKEMNCTPYTDMNEMFADENVDAVIILTASGLHADMGIAAAKAGKHVIVEKPIDINIAKAIKLVEAGDENNVSVSCIFQHRYDDDTIALKAAIDNNELGQINSGCCHTKWYRGQDYYDAVAWRGTRALDGGGALMNQGIHQLDLFQYLMGEVDEVFGYTATRDHLRIEVEDICMATLKFKNGAIAILEANVCAYPGFYTRIDINGSYGSVILENNTVQRWELRSGKTYEGIKTNLPHKLQLEEIIRSIKAGVPSLVNGREALKSLLLVDAIYKSGETGRPVKIDYSPIYYSKGD